MYTSSFCLSSKAYQCRFARSIHCCTIMYHTLTNHQLLYVTGYWKTDHNVTLGQLQFIGPANSHTHTLSMHRCITGLSLLVCFSRTGFADRVKSRLRQWDPWRALDGRYGSDIHPCVGEMSLKALQSCLGL